MWRRRLKIFCRPIRALATVVVLAVLPKCVLCAAAYAGVGAALRPGGPELCGAPAGPVGHWTWLLPALGVALGWFAVHRRHSLKL